jgi:hypothetical protein
MKRSVVRTPIRDLSCRAIDVKPTDFDWSNGYGETWEYVEASRCEKCDAAITTGCASGEKHSDADPESTCDGHVPYSEGPMMNYYYIIPGGEEWNEAAIEDAACRIADLPLCIVRFSESHLATTTEKLALALTGGGMDLSWEICEAFMVLGYLPPLHFADLPGMAGRGTGERDKWITDACLESCKVAAGWASSKATRIRNMRSLARKRERERGKAAS